MNLGNLPGFYYDASKGKYFKIQANHAAPAEAKYAKSNVDREKREAKKRKLEERHDQIVRKQTVPAARLLKSPLLGGSGVRRVSTRLPEMLPSWPLTCSRSMETDLSLPIIRVENQPSFRDCSRTTLIWKSLDMIPRDSASLTLITFMTRRNRCSPYLMAPEAMLSTASIERTGPENRLSRIGHPCMHSTTASVFSHRPICRRRHTSSLALQDTTTSQVTHSLGDCLCMAKIRAIILMSHQGRTSTLEIRPPLSGTAKSARVASA